jgi:hypothetical protein
MKRRKPRKVFRGFHVLRERHHAAHIIWVRVIRVLREITIDHRTDREWPLPVLNKNNTDDTDSMCGGRE